MTIINNVFNKKFAAIIVLFVILTPTPGVRILAQTCDPLPTDPDQLLECNLNDNQYFPAKTYEPGTDPSNPAQFPANGTFGIAAAYNPTNDKLLVAAHNSQNDRITIQGYMADPVSLATIGSAFRIDTSGGDGFRGSPKIAYSADANKFLVIWLDTRPCGERCSSIYGRFVSADGVPEGTRDIAINTVGSLAMEIAYDSVNKKFVIGYEPAGSVMFKTVDLNGNISAGHTIATSYEYQGQMGLAVNSNQNEYWFTFTVASGDGTTENDRSVLTRFDAKNLTKVGSDTQLSTPRQGHNAFGQSRIAYSPQDGSATAMWLERGREGVAGMWGRTIYDDGSMSDEYPIITTQTFIYSEGYSSNQISYNPWTNTYFVFSGDWDGNAVITEIGSEGFVYSNEYAISINTESGFLDNLKQWLMPRAYAAFGSFNVVGAVTIHGAVTLASRNYTTVVATSYASPNVPGPTVSQPASVPPTGTAPDTKSLPKLINQIYVWGLGLSVLLALLMMVLGGYYIMTAAGNAEQATKGKEFITSALIGVVIIFTAYLLLNQINPDLVNFNLDSLKGL
ncbi:MAG: pilin [Candidatus Doudnabacteria bacterium]|nr:pilin [Candidatus Doudnabacteria bacterium]